MWSIGLLRGSLASSRRLLNVLPAPAPPTAACTAAVATSGTQQSQWHGPLRLFLPFFSGLALVSTCAVGAEASEDEAHAAAPPAEIEGRWTLLPLPRRQRIFFKYEKRIREFSSYEKIFEYFATEETDGIKYMSLRDLVRAIVPTYPPHASRIERAGALHGERHAPVEARAVEDELLSLIDVDGDGTISFSEFLLLIALLSVPQTDTNAVFQVVDSDGSGSIDAQEFQVVTDALRKKAGMTGHAHPRTGKTTGLGADQVRRSNGMLDRFFSADKDGRLSLSRFTEELALLHAHLHRLEFAHYDIENHGSISATDFATSMVTAAHITHVDHLLDKAANLPDKMANTRFSYSDFAALAALRARLRPLAVALEFSHLIGRPVGAASLAHTARDLAGVELSPALLELVMEVFGTDTHGGERALDVFVFLDVMKRRERIMGRKGELESGTSEAGQTLSSKLDCLWKCVS